MLQFIVPWIRKPIKDRLLDNITPGPNGCWIWKLSKFTEGYGRFYVERDKSRGGKTTTRSAHVVSYETFIGPVPEGWEIDHLCRTRSCIRPDHLEAVPKRTNILRGIGMGAINARKTRCKNDHDLNDPKTTRIRIQRNGHPNRICLICRKIDARERREVHKKAAAPTSKEEGAADDAG